MRACGGCLAACPASWPCSWTGRVRATSTASPTSMASRSSAPRDSRARFRACRPNRISTASASPWRTCRVSSRARFGCRPNVDRSAPSSRCSPPQRKTCEPDAFFSSAACLIRSGHQTLVLSLCPSLVVLMRGRVNLSSRMRRLLVNAVVLGIVLCVSVAGQDRAQFSTNADLVVLHVNVKDKRGAYVTDLRQETFAVFEDGRPQTIRFFAKEDAPVTMGLIVDSSASMYANRDDVIAAAAAFTAASNPRDELFALVFNERVRPALPAASAFTSDREFFRSALARIFVPSGRTALFDAVSAGLEYLRRGRYERRDLILISDGGDNASRTTFDDVIA